MTNKCPNCGFEYNDDDIFCSKCGSKLNSSESQTINQSLAQFETKELPQNDNIASFNKKVSDNNTLFNTAIILLIILGIMCFIMFIILDKHNNHKETLQFKNLITNPSQIPILKEPSDYKQLALNLKNTEDFLLLYLKKSSDNTEKKEQIFSNYLNELDKLPNILNQKIEDIEQCQSKNKASCVSSLNNTLKDTGAVAYTNFNSIYLYPNYKFILNNYQKYLSNDYKNYLKLQTKYNKPVTLNLQLLINPTKLANKISDFEKLYLKTQNEYIKEKCEEIVYDNLRAFLFTPSIYATTTQEMKPEFKKAYEYFIKNNKISNLNPLIMSYLDKKRAYSEENFKNDYPYKIYDKNLFENNVKNSTFEDIFVQLRKNIFANKNIDLKLAFVYDLKNGKWKKYNPLQELSSSEYVISEPDENNNISIYNNVFSPMQEMNILKYSELYLISDGLYIFNKDKLNISKITYNGKTFNTYNLKSGDITSLFPGIEIINIDSLQSYNVIIEKANAKANYIIISRYSQGWSEYDLENLKGSYTQLILPNMFAINSTSDVEILFKSKEKDTEEFQEDKPPYKFIIKTFGYKNPTEEKENFIQYDKKTQDEEEDANNPYTPNIMPKLKSSQENIELEAESLLIPPEQKIQPPKEND